MFGKIAYTWDLMKASWDVLKKDKTLLVFPLLSGLCCLLVLASFAVPFFLVAVASGGESATHHVTVSGSAQYGLIFLFYLATYFVITFFNTAIVSCAILRLTGGSPTVGDGFREAAARLPLIAAWAVLSATVGMILRMIEDRSKWVGRIVAGLLGMAWTVVSFLVVPVLVVERKGPFQALKESASLLSKTWGEQLVGNFSFGMIFFLLMLPALALVVLSIFSGSGLLIIACIGLAFLYLMALSLIQSALQSIFQAAVYLYAHNGTAPEGFSDDLMSGAMRAR